MSELSWGPMKQDDLFDSRSSVHKLVETYTAEELLKKSGNHVREPGRNAPIDVLAGRRGAKTIRSAAKRAVLAMELDLANGKLTDALHAYGYAAWAHAGLPRRDLKEPSRPWVVTTDYARLEVQPGTRREDGDGPSEYIGVPYGSYARLAMLHWQSVAYKTGSREVFIGRSISDALKQMNLPHNSDANSQLREQIDRLSVCTIRFSVEGGSKGLLLNHTLVEEAEYAYQRSISGKGGDRRFIQRLILTKAYYDQLMKFPVTMDETAILELMDSPTALDIYTWLCWRLPYIKDEARIGWTSLKAQLGPNIKSMSDFKPVFRVCFMAAHAVYRGADMELADFGVILRPSPPPVPQRRLVNGVSLAR